ncbi:MAG: orotate phosphoribosyltransferase [bacterium]|nr:orotate phosphoribosyltransferase [bacterium]
MNRDQLTADVMARLRETEAILDGHFILTSGKHSNRYIQCAKLLSHTGHAGWAGATLAEAMPDFNLVVSPAMGGIIIGHEVAKAKGTPFFFTERVEGKMTLRRGFSLPTGAKVAVVEDVVTSGGSLVEVVELLQGAGVEVTATASIVDRSGGRRPDFGAPFTSLIELDVQVWDPSDCPLCADGSEAVKPGSRGLK